MEGLSARELRAALAPYVERSTPLAWTLLLSDLAIYAAAVAGAVALTSPLLRVLCAVAAGAAISPLFVIGHDAAHGAYTGRGWMNRLIGRIAFLPALHNYSLWQVQHNRLHHRLVNIRGFNSWSPLTKAEYDRLPRWRRGLERLYRSPLGFAPYYLIERWWQDKFFPRRGRGARGRPVHWLDFTLLLAYLVLFVTGLALAGRACGSGALAAVGLGFVLPYVVWNALMGATIYMQHTHPRVPWFESMAEWRTLEGQHDLTVHVRFPRWYGLISHHIMAHPAHHVLPKIPLYRLAAAQRRLEEMLGERAIIERFTLRYLFDTLRRCKLYDYQEHRWVDFTGRPSTERTLAAQDPHPKIAVA